MAVRKAQQEMSLLLIEEIDTMMILNEWFDFLDGRATKCKQRYGSSREDVEYFWLLIV